MSVREGLLALLHERPSYGYQLKTSFETATGGVWTLNVGQVYKTLDRLERDGFVEAEGAEGQRSYRITDDGVDELGTWWDATPEDEPPPRDELVLKVMLAVACDRPNALDVITRQRAAVMSMLQRHRRARPPENRHDPLAAAMVSDALVVRAEADLRWLDLCEERLANAERTDTPPARRGTRTRGGTR